MTSQCSYNFGSLAHYAGFSQNTDTERKCLQCHEKILLKPLQIRGYEDLSIVCINCFIKSLKHNNSTLNFLERICYQCKRKVMINPSQVPYYPNFNSPIKCIPCGRKLIATPPFSQL